MNRKARARRIKRRLSSKTVLNCDKWSIMHTKIRGYDSKVLSLQTMVAMADILTINETFLKNKSEIFIPEL